MKEFPPPVVVKAKQDFASEKSHEILGVREDATKEEIRAAKRRFALANQEAIAGTNEAGLEMYKRINQAAAEMTKALKEKESLAKTPALEEFGSEEKVPKGNLEVVGIGKKKRVAEREPLRITHEETLKDISPASNKKTRKPRREPVQTPEVIALAGPETLDKEAELAQTQIPPEDLVGFSEKGAPVSPQELARDGALANSLSTPATSDPDWDPVIREEGPSVEERLAHERRESAQVVDKKLRNIKDEWAGYEPEEGPSLQTNRPEPGVGPTVEERLAYEFAQQGSADAIAQAGTVTPPSEAVRATLERVAISPQEVEGSPGSKEAASYWSTPTEKKEGEGQHSKPHKKGHGDSGHHAKHGHGKPLGELIARGAIGGAGALILLFFIKAFEFGRAVWGSLLGALGFKGKKKEKPAAVKPAAAHDHH